jgi:hypothetical protein
MKIKIGVKTLSDGTMCFYNYITYLGVEITICDEAISFVKEQKTIQTIWENCIRGEWLGWILDAIGQKEFFSDYEDILNDNSMLTAVIIHNYLPNIPIPGRELDETIKDIRTDLHAEFCLF